jgi:SAM-dependent methyltransferase
VTLRRPAGHRLYDAIGGTYATTRRTEPRIAARIWAALGDARTVLAAAAGSLPFADQSFDAAMAVLSDHHWPDPIVGLREMRRVALRVVVFQFDTSDPLRFWLTRDYLPEFGQLARSGPTLQERADAIGARLQHVPIPWDCADGFFHAHWRRPEAYLRSEVRQGASVWARVGLAAEERAIRNLSDDLASGRWAERNRDSSTCTRPTSVPDSS